jgi:hypothetical protein
VVCFVEPCSLVDAAVCSPAGTCAVGSGACGGFAGLTCPNGGLCVDDPRDGCDPELGGADCPGVCIHFP